MDDIWKIANSGIYDSIWTTFISITIENILSDYPGLGYVTH